MRILGIDPGLAIVGFGLIEAEIGKTQMLQYGAVTTPAGLPLAARLVQLERDMEELIAQLRPEAIAVEELFFSNNITTGIAVAHARGIILCTAAKSGIPLFEYTPMQVKQAVVGYGLAEKRQVMDMVRRLLKLKAVPRPDDAADALALAICHARSATSLLARAQNPVKQTVKGGRSMFYYLEGKVAHVEPYLAVIDCGGVGYACRTTNHTIRQLKKGEVKRLYTYLNVGDGIFELYGFATEQELNSFKLLIGVSGVGPKAALAILSVGTPEHLTMAVITGDEKALTAAPGVGKKLAQRILLELKDKIAKETQEIGLPASAGGAALGSGSKAAEAAAALAVLGYTQQDISAALKGVDVETLPLEEIVRQSLKKMVK